MLKIVVEFCGMQLKSRKKAPFCSEQAERREEMFSKKGGKERGLMAIKGVFAHIFVGIIL